MGEWRAGKRHGLGDHFFRKGDYYTGSWKDDMKHGTGTLVSANGARYTGNFCQDKKHGKGELKMPPPNDGLEEGGAPRIFEEVWNMGIL